MLVFVAIESSKFKFLEKFQKNCPTKIIRCILYDTRHFELYQIKNFHMLLIKVKIEIIFEVVIFKSFRYVFLCFP